MGFSPINRALDYRSSAVARRLAALVNTAAVVAGLIVLMVISLLLLTILKLVEKRAVRWQNAKGVIRTDELVQGAPGDALRDLLTNRFGVRHTVSLPPLVI